MELVLIQSDNQVVGVLAVQKSGVAELRIFRVNNNNLFEYKDEVLDIIVKAKAYMNNLSSELPDWQLRMVF